MLIVAGASDKTKITVDGKLLCTTTEAIALIGGCRCCTIRSDLVGALRRLAPHSGQVAIEMSARADPWPILRTFMTDRALGAQFHVEEAPDKALGGSLLGFVLDEHRPLTWDTLSRVMETLVATRGPDLLLAEGLLDVAGCRGPVAVRFMQHLALPPVELAVWDADRRSRITFITRNIREIEIKRLFDAVRALA